MEYGSHKAAIEAAERKIARLTKQRDELVAAIKEIYNLRPFGRHATDYSVTVEHYCRNALASVKGGA